jgi:hypothetical protein
MKIFIPLAVVLVLMGCNSTKTGSDTVTQYYDLDSSWAPAFLTRIPAGELYQFGDACGYINPTGDTIVPVGQYMLCLTDTIRTFGIVMPDTPDFSTYQGIDKQGRLLYEIPSYDNGPDWVSEGRFRIIRNGKTGYADEDGFIKIEPQFECANPFEGGRAKVALECELVPDGEYTRMESEEWFYIDRSGKRVEE